MWDAPRSEVRDACQSFNAFSGFFQAVRALGRLRMNETMQATPPSPGFGVASTAGSTVMAEVGDPS
jgi:hypothetical protein